MAIVTIGNIPVYDALITDEETGMLKISLVDDPAVMSNFLAFDNTKKMLMYAVSDEEKRIVRGVVMRANFPIYRRDERMGEYYIIYKPETIRTMAEKYLVEGRQNNINLMHQADTDVEGVQMVQYFIKDTENGVNPSGFEDIADGSLFAEFHIVNDNVWDAVKGGTFKGFSLEGVFDLAPEEDKEKVVEIVDSLEGKFKKFVNRLNHMSKLSKFKEALAKALAEFGNITTDGGILVWDGVEDLQVGDAVFIEDENGERLPAEDKEYKTDTNIYIIVDGKVSEIVDAEVAPEVVEEPKEEETPAPEVEPEVAPEVEPENEPEEAPEAEEPKPEIPEMAVINTDKGELLCDGELAPGAEVFIPSDEGNSPAPDGDYVLEDGKILKVAEGKVAEIVEAKPEVDEAEALRTENASLKEQIAELQAKVEELSRIPAANPAHEEVVTASRMPKTGIKGLDRLADLINA